MYGIGGGGFAGLAFEAVANTYQAPTKFFPFMSESLKYDQATRWRRPIRKNVDNLGGVAGNVHINGDISAEATEDLVPYFHYASRATVVKSGIAPNFTYTVTPNANATPTAARTLSITVVRNGAVFGYVGCVVSNFSYTIDDGTLMFNASILGSDEASQSLPVEVFTDTPPFGAGQYDIQIPTASTTFELDTFTFEVNDNGDPQFRAKNTGRGAQFIKFGERQVTFSCERDFQTRTDYDAFKALVAQGITVVASKSATNSITLLVNQAVKDTYEVGLSGQGDLIRGSIAYEGTYSMADSKAYQITIKTQEDIT